LGDQTIRKRAVALIAMVLEPGGMGGVGYKVLSTDPMMLAADHAP
jgi:hypothetical protein